MLVTGAGRSQDHLAVVVDTHVLGEAPFFALVLRVVQDQLDELEGAEHDERTGHEPQDGGLGVEVVLDGAGVGGLGFVEQFVAVELGGAVLGFGWSFHDDDVPEFAPFVGAFDALGVEDVVFGLDDVVLAVADVFGLLHEFEYEELTTPGVVEEVDLLDTFEQ